MARLLQGGAWYWGVSSNTFYEHEFETLILQEAPLVYPGWRVVPFKVNVESDEDRRQPDLALIDPDYREWWVVEVELAHHSFSGHVLPQLLTFVRGYYGTAHAKYLAAKDPELDRSALDEMMLGSPPGVHVLVNDYVPTWMPTLAHWDVKVGVAEVFISDLNEFAIRLNGEIPSPPDTSATRCVRVSVPPNAWRVESPIILPDAETHMITIQGKTSRWSRVRTADAVYLVPQRGDPVPNADAIVIGVGLDGSLSAEVSG